MPKTKHRLVIDTNLWISLLLTRDFSKFDPILFSDTVKLLLSQELLYEFIEVARRPKFKKYFSMTDLQDLLEQISSKAELVTVTSTTDICRDPKDNFLLALSADGKATHLLTGDNDLLDLKKFGKTAIMTISAYVAMK